MATGYYSITATEVLMYEIMQFAYILMKILQHVWVITDPYLPDLVPCGFSLFPRLTILPFWHNWGDGGRISCDVNILTEYNSQDMFEKMEEALGVVHSCRRDLLRRPVGPKLFSFLMTASVPISMDMDYGSHCLEIVGSSVSHNLAVSTASYNYSSALLLLYLFSVCWISQNNSFWTENKCFLNFSSFVITFI
jgi:hypothetical protein